MRVTGKNIYLFIRTFIVVLLIIGAKSLLHMSGYEFIVVNNLFSGLVAANVFLMGFLISGILADYKESEKIPTELTVSLSTLYEDILSLGKIDQTLSEKALLEIKELGLLVKRWFYRASPTRALLQALEEINYTVTAYDGLLQPAYVIRMKQEITSIKRLLLRTDTIRDTNFISSGYMIATFTTIMLCFGLVFSKITPFSQSIFFVGAISFLMVFLILLIHDLDNPFNYKSRLSVENISLYPLDRFNKQISSCHLEEKVIN